MMINALELTVNRKSKNMQGENKSIHKLLLQNAELTSHPGVKLQALNNQHRKAAVGQETT